MPRLPVRRRSTRYWACLVLMGGLSWAWSIVEAGDARPVNRIERLRQKLTAGEHLASDDRWGYLPAMLEQLEVSPDSQTLVFSKTSFQQHQISPERPRAIYFNDDCYVAWVRDSPTIEFAVADGEEGVRFYTLTVTPTRWLSIRLRCRRCWWRTKRGVRTAIRMPPPVAFPDFLCGPLSAARKAGLCEGHQRMRRTTPAHLRSVGVVGTSPVNTGQPGILVMSSAMIQKESTGSIASREQTSGTFLRRSCPRPTSGRPATSLR